MKLLNCKDQRSYTTSKGYMYLIFLSIVFLFTCKKTEEKVSPDNSDSESTDEITQVMERVANWQIDNLPIVMELPSGIIEPLTNHSWVRATFLSGVMALHDVNNNKYYLDHTKELCEKVDYKLGERERHADEFAIGRVYTDIYLKTREDQVLRDLKKRIDAIIENPSRPSEVGWKNEKNWAWCDALFMAPPAWLKLYTCTGKRRYLNEMNTRYWDTYHHLYSKQDSLFFRDARYIIDENGNGPRTVNGKKIFWGRGNGWVVGGLTDILTYIPGDFPDRSAYEQLFQELMAKVARLQGDDGMWRSSLLDYEEYPVKEFSSSAFFCYAMAWGINHQVLSPDEYLPKIEKAWDGLLGCIDKSGKIGYIQRVGADPESVSADDTMEYGPGAFLLAGREVYELQQKKLYNK